MEAILNTPSEYIGAYALMGYYVWPWLGYLLSKCLTRDEEALAEKNRDELQGDLRHVSLLVNQLSDKFGRSQIISDRFRSAAQSRITSCEKVLAELAATPPAIQTLASLIDSLQDDVRRLDRRLVTEDLSSTNVAKAVTDLKDQVSNLERQLLTTQRDAKATIENFDKRLEATKAKIPGPIKYIDSALLDMLRKGCRKFVLDLLDKLKSLKEEEWEPGNQKSIQAVWDKAGLVFTYVDRSKLGFCATLPGLVLTKRHLEGGNVGKPSGQYGQFSPNERLLFFFHFNALCDKLCKTSQTEPAEYVARISMIESPTSTKVEEAFKEIGANCRVSTSGLKFLETLQQYLLDHGPISRNQLDDHPFKQFYENKCKDFNEFFGAHLVLSILNSLVKHGLLVEPTEDKPVQPTEDKPVQPTEDKPGQSTEDKPGQSTEDKPGQSTEDKPGQPTEDKQQGVPRTNFSLDLTVTPHHLNLDLADATTARAHAAFAEASQRQMLAEKVDEALAVISKNHLMGERGEAFFTCLKEHVKQFGPVAKKELDEPPFKSFYATDFDCFFGYKSAYILNKLMDFGIVVNKFPQIDVEKLLDSKQPIDRDKIDQVFNQIYCIAKFSQRGYDFFDLLKRHLHEHGTISLKQLDEPPFQQLYDTRNKTAKAFLGFLAGSILDVFAKAGLLTKEETWAKS